MENLKNQILNSLSKTTPICIEELFDLNNDSEKVFQVIDQLEASNKIIVIGGGISYIKLA